MAAPSQPRGGRFRPVPGIARPFRHVLVLVLPALLAACASQPAYRAASDYARSSHTYPPPGPAEDPWGPYIREASGRFGVPQQWVRAVMHQESGGHATQNGRPITSSAGAMGLMQVMPATYRDLRDQFGLGEDPYDPHNSILAGTAYIRQMYDRYGAPGFLAAYNAGPQRLDDYLAGNGSLPNETVNYLASITPHLGRERPLSGPLAAYADSSQPVSDQPVALPAVARGRGVVRLASARTRAGGCVRDPDAAFDAPCGSRARPPQPEVLAAAVPMAVPAGPGCVRDPDAAFDSPCGAAPAVAPVVASVAFRPQPAPGCVRDPDAAFDSPCVAAAAPAVASRPMTALWQPPAASGGSRARKRAGGRAAGRSGGRPGAGRGGAVPAAAPARPPRRGAAAPGRAVRAHGRARGAARRGARRGLGGAGRRLRQPDAGAPGRGVGPAGGRRFARRRAAAGGQHHAVRAQRALPRPPGRPVLRAGGGGLRDAAAARRAVHDRGAGGVRAGGRKQALLF